MGIAKKWVVASLVYLCAAAIGVGSAWMVLRGSWLAQSVQVGPWVTSTLAGSIEADMYTRARVALDGLLALGRSETMYYVARTDSAGRPLRSACSYRVLGTVPDARWWSVTAYADDMFLFDAPNRHYSLNGTVARLDAKGRFSMVTGPPPMPAPASEEGPWWLPTPGNRGLVLTLRLYNPGPALQASPASLQPPTIDPVGACP
jgi:hypothetical protein